jgi:hypothetical protein
MDSFDVDLVWILFYYQPYRSYHLYMQLYIIFQRSSECVLLIQFLALFSSKKSFFKCFKRIKLILQLGFSDKNSIGFGHDFLDYEYWVIRSFCYEQGFEKKNLI